MLIQTLVFATKYIEIIKPQGGKKKNRKPHFSFDPSSLSTWMVVAHRHQSLSNTQSFSLSPCFFFFLSLSPHILGEGALTHCTFISLNSNKCSSFFSILLKQGPPKVLIFVTLSLRYPFWTSFSIHFLTGPVVCLVGFASPMHSILFFSIWVFGGAFGSKEVGLCLRSV